MKRKMQKLALVGVMVATGVLAAPASAHHSHAMFDVTKELKMRGTVTQWQMTNPHSFLQVAIPARNGGTQEWSLELQGGATSLRRKGWNVRAILEDGTIVEENPGGGLMP